MFLGFQVLVLRDSTTLRHVATRETVSPATGYLKCEGWPDALTHIFWCTTLGYEALRALKCRHVFL